MTILVDEMEVLRVRREAGGKATGAVGDMKGWEVWGRGRGGSEGFVYLLHPCGRGGVDEKRLETEGKEKGKERGEDKKGMGIRGRIEREIGQGTGLGIREFLGIQR